MAVGTKTAFEVTVGTDYTLLADFTANTNNNSAIEHKFLQLICSAGVRVEFAWDEAAEAPDIILPANLVAITQERKYGIHGKLYAKVASGTQPIVVNVW